MTYMDGLALLVVQLERLEDSKTTTQPYTNVVLTGLKGDLALAYCAFHARKRPEHDEQRLGEQAHGDGRRRGGIQRRRRV